MSGNSYRVKFYADSTKYGKNYLFIFKVGTEQQAIKLAKKYNAKAAWFCAPFGNLQKRIL